MSTTYKNFTAGLRKNGLISRGMMPVGSDLSWIEDMESSPSTGDVSVTTVSGVVSGTDGTDGNAVFTLGAVPINGVFIVQRGSLRSEGVAFTRVGDTVTFLAPYIPIVGDPDLKGFTF